jgi:hypothetical protein
MPEHEGEDLEPNVFRESLELLGKVVHRVPIGIHPCNRLHNEAAPVPCQARLSLLPSERDVSAASHHAH